MAPKYAKHEKSQVSKKKREGKYTSLPFLQGPPLSFNSFSSF